MHIKRDLNVWENSGTSGKTQTTGVQCRYTLLRKDARDNSRNFLNCSRASPYFGCDAQRKQQIKSIIPDSLQSFHHEPKLLDFETDTLFNIKFALPSIQCLFHSELP